ncbi:hypothetical protein EI94DRAFT_1701636 [Lactarius quietus]|nr:hypothetical protein EI94DRAFT_1701636 [Lactarius quietus]
MAFISATAADPPYSGQVEGPPSLPHQSVEGLANWVSSEMPLSLSANDVCAPMLVSTQASNSNGSEPAHVNGVQGHPEGVTTFATEAIPFPGHGVPTMVGLRLGQYPRSLDQGGELRSFPPSHLSEPSQPLMDRPMATGNITTDPRILNYALSPVTFQIAPGNPNQIPRPEVLCDHQPSRRVDATQEMILDGTSAVVTASPGVAVYSPPFNQAVGGYFVSGPSFSSSFVTRVVPPSRTTYRTRGSGRSISCQLGQTDQGIPTQSTSSGSIRGVGAYGRFKLTLVCSKDKSAVASWIPKRDMGDDGSVLERPHRKKRAVSNEFVRDGSSPSRMHKLSEKGIVLTTLEQQLGSINPSTHSTCRSQDESIWANQASTCGKGCSKSHESSERVASVMKRQQGRNDALHARECVLKLEGLKQCRGGSVRRFLRSDLLYLSRGEGGRKKAAGGGGGAEIVRGKKNQGEDRGGVESALAAPHARTLPNGDGVGIEETVAISGKGSAMQQGMEEGDKWEEGKQAGKWRRRPREGKDDDTLAAKIRRRTTAWMSGQGRESCGDKPWRVPIQWGYYEIAGTVRLTEGSNLLSTQVAIPAEAGIKWKCREPPQGVPVLFRPARHFDNSRIRTTPHMLPLDVTQILGLSRHLQCGYYYHRQCPGFETFAPLPPVWAADDGKPQILV